MQRIYKLAPDYAAMKQVMQAGIDSAQAITNSAAYPSNSLVTDMIQRGSALIDELSGKVYEVTSREVDPSASTPRAAYRRSALIAGLSTWAWHFRSTSRWDHFSRCRYLMS